jgi:hypothetical protein
MEGDAYSLTLRYWHFTDGKGKGIPLQAWTGP